MEAVDTIERLVGGIVSALDDEGFVIGEEDDPDNEALRQARRAIEALEGGIVEEG